MPLNWRLQSAALAGLTMWLCAKTLRDRRNRLPAFTLYLIYLVPFHLARIIDPSLTMLAILPLIAVQVLVSFEVVFACQAADLVHMHWRRWFGIGVSLLAAAALIEADPEIYRGMPRWIGILWLYGAICGVGLALSAIALPIARPLPQSPRMRRHAGLWMCSLLLTAYGTTQQSAGLTEWVDQEGVMLAARGLLVALWIAA